MSNVSFGYVDCGDLHYTKKKGALLFYLQDPHKIKV